MTLMSSAVGGPHRVGGARARGAALSGCARGVGRRAGDGGGGPVRGDASERAPLASPLRGAGFVGACGLFDGGGVVPARDAVGGGGADCGVSAVGSGGGLACEGASLV